MGPRPRLIVVVGPTAAGKSELGIALARRFGGEILNADSRQVYRGLDLGTAKPSAGERAIVPHHLFDLIGPGEAFSAAEFRRLAIDTALDISRRGRVPIVVGGSGLYVRALLQGFFDGPAQSTAIHARLAALADRGGLGRLHRWLQRVDGDTARRVPPRDRQRVLRALDVYLQTGKPLSEHQRQGGTAGLPFEVLQLGVAMPRPDLYQRIGLRADEMVRQGLLAEVEGLRKLPGFRGSNAEKSVGYRVLSRHLDGELALDAAVSLMKQETRRLAKRQTTWFRRDATIRWVKGTLPSVEGTVDAWLGGAKC